MWNTPKRSSCPGFWKHEVPSSSRPFRVLSCCLEPSTETKMKVLKLSKKFSELPKFYMPPGGSPVVPLAQWRGGLESLAYGSKLQRPRSQSELWGNAGDATFGSVSMSIEQTLSTRDVTVSSDNPVKAKLTRGKRKKIDALAEDASPTLEAPAEAGRKPSRPKKAHIAQDVFPALGVSVEPKTKPGRPRKAHIPVQDVSPALDDSVEPETERGGRQKADTPAEDVSPAPDALVEPIPKRDESQKTTVPAGTVSATLEAPPEGKRTRRRRRKTVVPNLEVEEVNNEVVPPLVQEEVPVRVEPKTATPANITPRTQLAAEILQNLARFSHCILLTRVGGFYESYFDQATEVARLLNIKLTTRSWSGQRVLMCGFPCMHLDKYLKALVEQNNRFVALCEEFPRDSALGAKGGFERRVARVVTPGTLIDEAFLDPYENNYLLAIGIADGDPSCVELGLAWMDVSTGEFSTGVSSLDALRDNLTRISPREVVWDSTIDLKHPARQILAEEGYFVSLAKPKIIPGHVTPVLAKDANADDLTDSESLSCADGSSLTAHEDSAVALLTTYMRTNLMDHMPSILQPNRDKPESRMQIDAHTVKALEIRERIREGGTAGSLMSIVNRTVTSGGARLLSRWLCSPSASLKEIHARQSLVAFFHDRPSLREDLTITLNEVADTTRIIQRFLASRGVISDLTSVSSTVSTWTSIVKRLELEKKMEERERADFRIEDWASLDLLLSRIRDLQHVADHINSAILSTRAAVDETEPEDSDVTSEEALEPGWGNTFSELIHGVSARWSIHPEYSDSLRSLHRKLQDLLARKNTLEEELQRTYKAPSLTLRSSPGQGMHVHLSRKKHQAEIGEDSLLVPISESGTTKVYFLQEWSLLGADILDTVGEIQAAEREAFEGLRTEVNSYSTVLRRNARVIDELDATLSFATLAAELNFVRPVVTEEPIYAVTNSRHPTVERGLLTAGRVFTPNSVQIEPSSRLQIITGPNMAGKSTLLRQTALITILAQAGSFVPAESATIGIVDRLFSRVGARDDLFRDQSTFMVEMLEASEILRRATSKSMVIMDEVGRGTTVRDGLAVAFGAVCHLYSQNRCRALFATHFHELGDMLGYAEDHRGSGAFKDIAFFCTDVDETEDGHFAYSHRLRPGINRDSHGLKVAQLAGMPNFALGIARGALTRLNADQNVTSSVDLAAMGHALEIARGALTRLRAEQNVMSPVALAAMGQALVTHKKY
ncbi:hypothetical protein OE88DRAFT_1691084 [Heliocybe sulcata]|uniref:DNA mismatch repair proteins mutS family domain-containing protein n=1 Tax=Heliocybe sulcata TaxID=5364 RepID=A0A5C3NUG3_9AGAM|nr:hypothetical protein OE88DRAFT_1691084 [Heliocybe sulcata]